MLSFLLILLPWLAPLWPRSPLAASQLSPQPFATSRMGVISPRHVVHAPLGYLGIRFLEQLMTHTFRIGLLR